MHQNTSLNHRRLASGIGVWFEQEIENALRAADLANADVASAVPTREMEIYRSGYMAAINTLSAAFGCNYRTSADPEQPETLMAASRHPFVTLIGE